MFEIESLVSPRTKLLVFAVFIAAVITLLLSLMDIPLGVGYSRVAFVIVISVIFYALLTKISTKLRRSSPLKTRRNLARSPLQLKVRVKQKGFRRLARYNTTAM